MSIWDRKVTSGVVASPVPTAIDITQQMIERAATALMAEEAQGRLTDIYGQVSKRRACEFATVALEAALDLRRDD